MYLGCQDPELIVKVPTGVLILPTPKPTLTPPVLSEKVTDTVNTLSNDTVIAKSI
jgi:hypothetical protein